jgi:hypothetical protein
VINLASKVILTDVDECLFDWAQPFEAWVRESYPQHDPSTTLRDHWHVEAWLGCDIEHSRELIRQFNGDEQIWPYFEPLPGVEEVIHRLHNEGWKFVAITACDTDEATWVGRWHNLNEVFGRGVFDTLHCVGLASSKREALARYRPTIWVEDKMKHARDGAELGHTSFLIDYRHNQMEDHKSVRRVKDWEEIYQAIKEMEA